MPVCTECNVEIVRCQLHFDFCSNLCKWTFNDKISHLLKENQKLKEENQKLRKNQKPRDLFS
jgi:hypothetical protein